MKLLIKLFAVMVYSPKKSSTAIDQEQVLSLQVLSGVSGGYRFPWEVYTPPQGGDSEGPGTGREVTESLVP